MALDPAIEDIHDVLCSMPSAVLPGALNYTVSRIVGVLVAHPAFSYEQLMGAIGTLEAAKLELYRRLGASKENAALNVDGDIPEYDRAVQFYREEKQ